MSRAIATIAVAAATIAGLAGCSDESTVAAEPFELCTDEPMTVGDYQIEYRDTVIYEPALEGPTTAGEFHRFVVDGDFVEFRVGEVVGLPTVDLDVLDRKWPCLTLVVADES